MNAVSKRSAWRRCSATLGARLMVIGSTALVVVLTSAHVGTSQVVLEGRAGGYPVRVFIDPPGVVPAQVAILVRVLEGMPTRVTVRAAQWNVGTKGAPPAEDAALVPGDPGVWAHDLWIMTASSYAVYVAVEGPAGGGTLLVPMQTSATRTLGMETGMGIALSILGILLVSGLLTIVGAAVREGSLPPGASPTSARKRGARVAMASATAMLALAVVGGAKWWDVEEQAYKRRMYQPLAIDARVRSVDDTRVLTIAMTDSLWRINRTLPLIPDHGKLMHLFLIAAEDANAIAHLHPLRVHADSFVTRVPALPAGRYLLYGDLLFHSGTQRTLVDTIDVPVIPVVANGETERGVVVLRADMPVIDPDDSWRVVAAVPFGNDARLAGGGVMSLSTDAPPMPGLDLRLSVRVTNDDGQNATLEPYMGMHGHAMVLRRDAAVFVHLHPMGSASMTAQTQLASRERGDTVPAMAIDRAIDMAVGTVAGMTDAMQPHASHATPLAFPFVFPSAGAYRVFVQIKRAGRVETAAFDVTVPDAAGRTTPRRP